jgi:membrane-anchored protein YejM (alkaline phosphatase superfamily)
MYIRPFSLFNNLQRLISTAGYQRFISVDEILGVVLEEDRSLARLDGHLAHPERDDQMFKFDLCATLTELKGRLDHESDPTRPIFFYSQPQNLHIRVLSDFKAPRFDGMRIGTTQYFRPAVAALSRIDACFGGLIDYLKASGRYDDSIVVLTSDHGDAYGEDGRWGHANYLAPQTLRIPLIVHVPEALRRGREWDPNALVWLTDLTPTLYELLGYDSLMQSDVHGRPILSRGPRRAERDWYLVQSSYSDAFGLIDGRAERLYTASAPHFREQFFDLKGGASNQRALSGPDRLEFRRRLLESMARLNTFYMGPSKE